MEQGCSIKVLDLIATVLTAAAAFAATNIDDLIVLSVLFARRDERFHGRQIVCGQFLGFSVLVAASLAVSAGLIALPDELVGVLGLIPLALGVRGLGRARRARRARRVRSADLVGEAELDDRGPLTTFGVASITIANGADNIAVYAPLFATIGFGGFAATLIVFAVLAAVWCAAGFVIGSHRAVIHVVQSAGDYAIPVVLIALGVFIIARSGLLGAVVG